MYSVVLMMALTGGAEATECGNRCCGCTGRVHHTRCSGCTGCVGCGGMRHHRTRCCGYVAACCGYTAPVCPPVCCGATPPPPPPPPPLPPTKKTTSEATIVVTLPENARLTVDGNATTSTSTRRVLVTPALEVGGTYVYTLRAEVVQNGQTLAQTQTVTVVPGATTQVPFNFTQAVASR